MGEEMGSHSRARGPETSLQFRDTAKWDAGHCEQSTELFGSAANLGPPAISCTAGSGMGDWGGVRGSSSDSLPYL